MAGNSKNERISQARQQGVLLDTPSEFAISGRREMKKSKLR